VRRGGGMKLFGAELSRHVRSRAGRRSMVLLLRYMLVFCALLGIYSVLFHALMRLEGREHSWLTGVYWALTTMSTLGFGDVTFHSDLGRAFSLVVLLSGMAFLLVMLPFTFIEFFYSPWMQAEAESRAPRQLPVGTSGHVILTDHGPVASALISRLDQYDQPYVILASDLPQALQLHDLGLNVVLGDLDLPQTYERTHVRKAKLVAATGSDLKNTNVAFTVREIAPDIPIITTATSDSAEEVLKLAGSSHVLRLDEMMGRWLARRTLGGDARAHIIGRFDRLLIAEATVTGTPLAGKTLGESRLRELVGITVIGVWQRGRFESASPDTRLGPSTVMVLAGSQEQVRHYDELFCIYNVATAPILIVGSGNVGTATGRTLERRNLDYRIIERNAARVPNKEKHLLGDAADIETLERAGIEQAPAVIVTTNNDDTNIYLTILCRRLRPDIQLISRATLERNVSTLHRAGADFVMSYASMGATVIFNLLRRADVLMVAEGLNVFRVKVPASLAGKRIADTTVREETGCSIVAVGADDQQQINPDPAQVLPEGEEMVMIGSVESENRFLQVYGQD
jgi:voltage-gated potassium channel